MALGTRLHCLFLLMFAFLVYFLILYACNSRAWSWFMAGWEELTGG
jgi:hypothetical protein